MQQAHSIDIQVAVVRYLPAAVVQLVVGGRPKAWQV